VKIKNVQENIDRCRFCFMCRHVCTLGRATKEESLTPRSQSLSLSFILRDTFDYSEELAENIYKCCLCDFCRDWCQGGWDFPSAVRAARSDLVDKGLAPESVLNLKDEVLRNKNAYGISGIDEKLQKQLSSSDETADVLLLVGSDYMYADPEAAIAYMNILKKAGINYKVLEDEDTTACDLLNLGFTEEAREAAEKLSKIVFDSECSTVVVLSPDIEFFLSDNMLELGIDLEGIEIKGGVEFLFDLYSQKKLKLKGKYENKVTYHDSNALARGTKVFEEPRKMLKSLDGVDYVEMIWNKNEAHSAGSILTYRLFPELARDIADLRVADIIEVEAGVVVTSSPYDKKILEETADNRFRVVDIYKLFAELV